MNFRSKEKERLISLKQSLFSSLASKNGIFKNHSYDFCLNKNCSEENIYKSFRINAIKYFEEREIKWHDGIKTYPSTHLCCSQSACINFLFPYRYEPILLKQVLLNLGYSVKEVLPILRDKSINEKEPFIAFEWIGKKNYLREFYRGSVAKDEHRSRGKGFTSADFAFLFKNFDDQIQLVLGEWKYTEEYKNKGSLRFSKSGTDRLDQIYKPFLDTNSPLDISPFYDYSILFYDPFDQLMRLQLLAKQMELSEQKELNADIVSVLHIAPKSNTDLMQYIPNQELKHFGANIHEIWSNIAGNEKFKGFYLEDFRKIVTSDYNCRDRNWGNYINTRYNFA